jgi:hypothetical protein
MKINLLKMNFIDKKRYYFDYQIDEILKSRRIHLIKSYNGEVPTTLTYITSRIRDKKLKHKYHRIEVIIGNKNNANKL